MTAAVELCNLYARWRRGLQYKLKTARENFFCDQENQGRRLTDYGDCKGGVPWTPPEELVSIRLWQGGPKGSSPPFSSLCDLINVLEVAEDERWVAQGDPSKYPAPSIFASLVCSRLLKREWNMILINYYRVARSWVLCVMLLSWS